MSRPDKLKIGLVLDDSLDRPDGVQQYVLSVGEWLRSCGHEVHYLVGETKRTDIENIHSLARNISVSSNGNRMTIPLPASKALLKKLLERECYDILHVQVPYSPLFAHRVILAAPEHTAIVGTFHIVAFSAIIAFGTKVLAQACRRSLRRFSAMFSVSKAAQAYARQTYGMATDILPNVFDYDRFAEAKPALPSLDSPSTLKILFLGRLVERKGCADILKALVLLHDTPGLPPYELVVCGRGPLEARLRDFAKANGLANVSFTGFVEESSKPGYYAGADIAVFPSTGGESFGIVLLEAMASGRAAVLAADNVGYTSVLEDGPGMLFPVGDVPALAERIRRLLLDTSQRQAIAKWGQQHARSFDTKLVGQTLLARYYEVLRD